jgi:hypothetical protein
VTPAAAAFALAVAVTAAAIAAAVRARVALRGERLALRLVRDREATMLAAS